MVTIPAYKRKRFIQRLEEVLLILEDADEHGEHGRGVTFNQMCKRMPQRAHRKTVFKALLELEHRGYAVRRGYSWYLADEESRRTAKQMDEIKSHTDQLADMGYLW